MARHATTEVGHTRNEFLIKKRHSQQQARGTVGRAILHLPHSWHSYPTAAPTNHEAITRHSHMPSKRKVKSGMRATPAIPMGNLRPVPMGDHNRTRLQCSNRGCRVVCFHDTPPSLPLVTINPSLTMNLLTYAHIMRCTRHMTTKVVHTSNEYLKIKKNEMYT